MSVSFALHGGGPRVESGSGGVYPSQRPTEQMMYGIALAVVVRVIQKIPILDHLQDHF